MTEKENKENEENIVTESKLSSREERGHVIYLFQKILNMLIRELPGIKNDLNVKQWYNIIHIERWLRQWSKQVFWDYLTATHSSMENLLQNEFDQWSAFHCVRITFFSWESVILVNDPTIEINKHTGKAEITAPKGLLCLDDYTGRLSDKKKIDFVQLFEELGKLEKGHFKSESYNKKLWKILDITKNGTIDSTYTDRLALALNLKFERI